MGKTRLERRWRGEGHWGDEHYWDWERRKEKDALRPRRAGGYVERGLLTERAIWVRDSETDRLEGLSPGKPFLVGFGCRTVVAM